MTGIKVEVELVVETCISCGAIFGIPRIYFERRKADHEKFYCPNGHNQYYPQETEEERLRKLFLTEQQENRGLKETLEKLQKRVDAGMCPHCRRHFANVERHIKAKHSKEVK